jgi:hypothetical protein
MTMERRILEARTASLAWLETMRMPGAPDGVSRISIAHDAARWPGMLLPGTYNAVICRRLLGGSFADPNGLLRWLLTFRRGDGVFRVPGMTDAAVFKRPEPGETWLYIDFHVTNYSLGAIEVIAPEAMPVLEFAEPFVNRTHLKAWLADRDLRDPWLEGNNIVNLGSFLMGLRGQGGGHALEVLLKWHEYHQDPATGFWGVGQALNETRLLHAMAGSMHNYHLYYALGRTLPYQDKAVDYALSRPTGIDSACIDVDLVDLLVHAHDLIDHRRDEISTWLREKLSALLAFQNADGGFSDEVFGVRRQDGWVRGYEEPQGISNTFSTLFRWIAIAMIADLLFPGLREWQFRRMIGIGYRKERRS